MQKHDKVKNAQLAAEKAQNKQHVLEASQQMQLERIFPSMVYWHWLFYLEGLLFNQFQSHQ